MIEDYFQFLIKICHNHPYFYEFRLIKQVISLNHGFIRFSIKFLDESEIYVFEYVNSRNKKIDYSYHWQDKNQKLIKRWDNAPHHPQIDTFPHHLHHGEKLEPAAEPHLVDVLKIIEDEI